MLDTLTNRMNRSQLRELEKFGSRINRFGVNFAVCSVEGEVILQCEGDDFKTSTEQLIECSRQAIEECNRRTDAEEKDISVWRFYDTSMVLAVALKSAQTCAARQEIVGTALIDLGGAMSAAGQMVSFHASPDGLVQPDIEYFAEMLELVAAKFKAETKAEQQIDKVSTELSQTYEELVLLHRLSTNMRVTEADSNFLQMACDCLTEIVFVEGIAILLEKTINDGPRWVISAGSGLIDIDEQMAAILHSRLTEEINRGQEALLDSDAYSDFKYEWPSRIKNIIAVPFFGKEKAESHLVDRTSNNQSIMGMMVAVNRVGRQDFDSTDIKLFNSVAGGCAVFIENGRLFKDLKELFIGSLKALTSSIDAKDKYTHGHSERVAFISRWIAERLAEVEPMDEEQIHKIYLAGLLHDIGKIGIDEALLRKTGRLTDEEFERVRKHPLIGAGILREIKQMRDIVPGVLCHHERLDGKGYPNGLSGEQVPLSGRIVCLADSFDAMTSKRTYRNAMSVEIALEQIEKGLGTQFDEKIGRLFLESDIEQLWNMIRDDFSEIYGDGKTQEYGAAAVGTLIR